MNAAETPTARRLTANVGITTIGRLGQSALGFLAVAYMARVLGPASFGLLSYAGAMLTYFSILSSMGIHTFAGRATAQADDRSDEVGQMLSVLIILAALSFAALVAVTPFLHLTVQQGVILMVSGVEIVTGVGRITWAFSAVERMTVPTIAGICGTLGRLGFVLILVRGPNGVVWAAASTGVAGLIASVIEIVAFLRIMPIRLRFSIRLVITTVRRSFPMTVSLIMTSIYGTCDTVLLGYLRGAQDVAFYGAAYKLTGFLANIRNTYTQTSLPVVGLTYKNNPKAVVGLIRRNINLALAAALPIALGGWITAPALIRLIFGSSYSGALWAFRILLLSWFLSVAGIHYSNMLIASNRERSFSRAVMVGAVINVFGNLWAIPRYGVVGAAVASLVTECVVLAYSVVATGKKFGYYGPGLGITARILWNSLVMASAILIFIRLRIGVAVVIVLGIIIYGLLSMVTRVVVDLGLTHGWRETRKSPSQ